MKKSNKIGLIVIPIAILGGISFALFQFEDTLSFQPKNELEEIVVENTDTIDPLQIDDILSFDLENERDEISVEHTNVIASLGLPIIGFSDASVTIIVFNDYQCKDCKTWYDDEYPEISKNLIETQKANLVFLDSISLGNDSILIAEATFCANDQEKYSEYLEILFNSQRKIDEWAKSEQLKEFAMDLSLDLESFEECLDSAKYENTVLSNIDYAKSLGVDKIPVFKIFNSKGNEHILRSSVPSAVFENIVNELQ